MLVKWRIVSTKATLTMSALHRIRIRSNKTPNRVFFWAWKDEIGVLENLQHAKCSSTFRNHIYKKNTHLKWNVWFFCHIKFVTIILIFYFSKSWLTGLNLSRISSTFAFNPWWALFSEEVFSESKTLVTLFSNKSTWVS